MRTRSRTFARELLWHYKRWSTKNGSPCNGTVAVDTDYLRDVSSFETIIDTVGNRKSENPCDHSKVTDLTPNPGSYSMLQITANGFKHEATGFPALWYDRCRDNVMEYEQACSADEHSFQLYSSMLPGIKSEMDESFANFAIDFHHIRRIPSILPNVRTLSLYLRAFFKGKPRKRAIKDFTKYCANADLGIHFGILPLIDDIRSIHRAVVTSDRSYNRMKAKANKWLTRHARYNGPLGTIESITDPVSAYSVSCYGEAETSTISYYRSRHITKDVSCVKMRYKYRMPDIPDWLARTYSLLDTLGVNYNPKIIWDATKLSFVVDWFLKVGTFLKPFTTPALNPSVEVYSCIHSRHLTYRLYGLATVTVGGSVVCCDRTYDSYVRVAGIPPISSLRTTWDVDWFKIHVGGSLLVQGLWKE